MTMQIFQVDAFTDRLFTGNPAGVCMLPAPRTDRKAYQASARGGLIGVRLNGDRVFLAGKAVTVLRGELLNDVL